MTLGEIEQMASDLGYLEMLTELRILKEQANSKDEILNWIFANMGMMETALNDAAKNHDCEKYHTVASRLEAITRILKLIL